MAVQTPELVDGKFKAEQVWSHLRRDMLEGRLPAGSVLPPQREIGRRFGVAEGTVSLAMARLVQEGLIQRRRGQGSVVQDPARQETFTIDFVRSVEDSGSRPRLAVLAMMDAFARVCAERNQRAIWHQRLFPELAHPDKVVDELASAQVVVAVRVPVEFSRALHRRGVAVACVMKGSTTDVLIREPFTSFDIDRNSMVLGALNHLVSLGHREIAFAGRNSVPERTSAFLEAMQAHGLHISTEWVRESRTDDSTDLRPWLEQLLVGNPRPRAVCCATDHVAAKVERHLLDMGVRVPDEIAITAGDSGPEAEAAPVPITTFGPNYVGMARLVVEHAEQLKAPANPATSPLAEPIMLPLQLTIRGSCGAKLIQ